MTESIIVINDKYTAVSNKKAGIQFESHTDTPRIIENSHSASTVRHFTSGCDSAITQKSTQRPRA